MKESAVISRNHAKIALLQKLWVFLKVVPILIQSGHIAVLSLKGKNIVKL